MQIARSCADERRCGDFMVDHDISCETQLPELVSLNSVAHPVSSSSSCPSCFQPVCCSSDKLFDCLDMGTCDRL